MILFLYLFSRRLHPLPYGMGHIKEGTASIQLCLVDSQKKNKKTLFSGSVISDIDDVQPGITPTAPMKKNHGFWLFDFLTFKEDFYFKILNIFNSRIERRRFLKKFIVMYIQKGLSKRIWTLWNFSFFLFYQIIYSMFGFGPVNLDLRAQIQICCLDILEKSLWLEDTVTGGFGKFQNFINTSWEAYMCCPFSEKKLK